LALAVRSTDKLAALAREKGAMLISADTSEAEAVASLFAELDQLFGHLDVVL
jgi:NADP-dependent 3-hydroxy acid dehydrogenase YdfG